MARAGASKSLDKPAPRARSASEAVKPAPAKAAAKTTRKKTAEPAVKAAKAKKPAPTPPVKAGKAAKATKVTKPARPTKSVKATKATTEPAKTGTKPAKSAKAVKAAPAKTATKAKSPTVARNTRPRKTAEVPVAEAPKGRRGGAATKTPPNAAPAVVAQKVVESANFPAKTLDKLRRLLEEERETYVRQARDLAAEAEALASEREPGDTQFDEESGEGDTLNVERERDLALSASATQAVEEIDRALRRMDAGNYGICERCGKKIAVARLEALPFAALCIECKSREERRR
jgi:RNA polymerase-binding protein DksA